ncbi:MAG: hypothetical protein R2694_06790 [Ilumatobacteraceae bacterium]
MAHLLDVALDASPHGISVLLADGERVVPTNVDLTVLIRSSSHAQASLIENFSIEPPSIRMTETTCTIEGATFTDCVRTYWVLDGRQLPSDLWLRMAIDEQAQCGCLQPGYPNSGSTMFYFP